MSGEGGNGAVPLAGEAFLNAIPAEFKGHTALAPIKDMPGLVKSYINAQQMVGADKIALPKPDAPDTEWAGVFAKLGRPETPDQYGVKLPEGLPKDIDGLNEDNVKAVTKMFHEAGLTQRQAKALFEKLVGRQVETFKKGQDEMNTARTNFMNELKKAHGDALEVKLAQARQVVQNLGGKDFQTFLDETGLGDHPTMVKVFLTLGELMSNDQMIRDKFASSGYISNADEAKSEIAKLQSNKEFMAQYHNAQDPAHAAAVERMSRLYSVGYPGKTT